MTFLLIVLISCSHPQSGRGQRYKGGMWRQSCLLFSSHAMCYRAVVVKIITSKRTTSWIYKVVPFCKTKPKSDHTNVTTVQQKIAVL